MAWREALPEKTYYHWRRCVHERLLDRWANMYVHTIILLCQFQQNGHHLKKKCYYSWFNLSYYWKDITVLRESVYNCTQFRRKDRNCLCNWESQLWPLFQTDSKYPLGIRGKMDSTMEQKTLLLSYLWKTKFCIKKIQQVGHIHKWLLQGKRLICILRKDRIF